MKLFTHIGHQCEIWVSKHDKSFEHRIKLKQRKMLANKFRDKFAKPVNTKRPMMAFVALVAMSTSSTTIHANTSIFDTDSKDVGIDNRCSACISHDIRNFIGSLSDSNRSIKAFGGVTHNCLK